MGNLLKYLDNLASTKKIALGYAVIILLGTGLLMLPLATRGAGGAPVKDALFTATSATCVTGLVLHDTYQYWSIFGQLVILLLIQLGGIGFMSMAIGVLTFTKRKIGLKQRVTMQESVGAPQVGGIVRMTKFLIFGSLVVEAVGAFCLAFYYCPRLGFLEGIYFSVFHSISAFCNAGIDLMGSFAPGSSLATAGTNPLVNTVVMLLIIIGGLGFFVWSDVMEHKLQLQRYRLHTKIVLVTTLLLIFGGALGFFLLENGNPSMEGYSLPEKLQLSLFQSVTCRTAGFSTMDLTMVTEAGKGLMICLMLVGGSPGSTAGGLKTTTLAILFLSILVVFQKKKSVECFHRRIEETVLHNACCVMMLYLFLSMGGAILICGLSNIPFTTALFETVSAVATVGLSLGATAGLTTLSQLILVLLMYIGRIGGITILLCFSGKANAPLSQYPVEKVTVG